MAERRRVSGKIIGHIEHDVNIQARSQFPVKSKRSTANYFFKLIFFHRSRNLKVDADLSPVYLKASCRGVLVRSERLAVAHLRKTWWEKFARIIRWNTTYLDFLNPESCESFLK